jgi:phenylacetaldehyde dehydrogenase
MMAASLQKQTQGGGYDRPTPEIRSDTRAFLERDHKLLIGGVWVAGEGRLIEVENPASEAVIASTCAASLAQLDQAVAAARRALKGEWGAMVPRDRAAILYRMGDLLEQNADWLAELETLENGIPIAFSSRSPRSYCRDMFRYNAGWCTKITGETLDVSLNGREHRDFFVATLKEPVGVVGTIIPWNSPGPMLALKVAPVLAAGCTMVLKPAELTPLVAEAYAMLLTEAGMPAGVFNLVQGHGEDIGAAMAEHPDIDKISFTGSTAVGRKIVAASAASNLKKVAIELGGKSPFVVFPDANLDDVIPAAAMACFFVSGQACMAGTRLFLHEAIHDQVVDGIIGYMKTLNIGPGLDAKTQIAPVVCARQKARIEEYVRIGREEGATLVYGGRPVTGRGHYVEPALFTHVQPSMRIAQEEIFGPVQTVQKFGDGDEAGLYAAINDTVYGLSGSVWTSNIATAFRTLRQIDSGQVGVNTHAAISPETPFGGNRQSGWGREFGRDGVESYLKTKAVSFNLGESSEDNVYLQRMRASQAASAYR